MTDGAVEGEESRPAVSRLPPAHGKQMFSMHSRRPQRLPLALLRNLHFPLFACNSTLTSQNVSLPSTSDRAILVRRDIPNDPILPLAKDDPFSRLLVQLPSEYPAAHQHLVELNRQYHHAIAAALQPKLNRYLEAQPQDTLADKQRIATSVNSDLRELGLTIRCPTDGSPAILVADIQSGARAEYFAFSLRIAG